jgi:2,5-furandicarboxylate decarboxylase 1
VISQPNSEKELADKIIAAIEVTPIYYSELAEKFSDYDFPTIARTFGFLHSSGKLWQDPRGRLCLKDSKFAAKLPT